MTKEDLIKEFDVLIKAHYDGEIDSRDEWLREILSLKNDVIKKLIVQDISNDACKPFLCFEVVYNNDKCKNQCDRCKKIS